MEQKPPAWFMVIAHAIEEVGREKFKEGWHGSTAQRAKAADELREQLARHPDEARPALMLLGSGRWLPVPAEFWRTSEAEVPAEFRRTSEAGPPLQAGRGRFHPLKYGMLWSPTADPAEGPIFIATVAYWRTATGADVPPNYETVDQVVARIRAVRGGTEDEAFSALQAWCWAKPGEIPELKSYALGKSGHFFQIGSANWFDGEKVKDIRWRGRYRGSDARSAMVVFERADVDALLAPPKHSEAPATPSAELPQAATAVQAAPAETGASADAGRPPAMDDWRDESLPVQRRLELWFLTTIEEGWRGTQTQWLDKARLTFIEPISKNQFEELWTKHATEQMGRPGRKRINMPETPALRPRSITDTAGS